MNRKRIIIISKSMRIAIAKRLRSLRRLASNNASIRELAAAVALLSAYGSVRVEFRREGGFEEACDVGEQRVDGLQ